MSMSPALGPVARLMTRSLYTTLNGRMSWCHRLTLTEEALLEIEFGIPRFQVLMGSIFGQDRQLLGWYIQMQAPQVMVDM